MVAEMQATGAWYLAGQRIDGPKYLAIGRSTYYIAFLQRLAVELGAPSTAPGYRRSGSVRIDR